MCLLGPKKEHHSRKETYWKKKPPGPKPELFSLYPLKFEEPVDILVKAKPKCRDDEETEEMKGKSKKLAGEG